MITDGALAAFLDDSLPALTPAAVRAADDPGWLDRRADATAAIGDALAAVESGDPDGDVVRHLRRAITALEVPA